jgi:hypothetical protein
MSLAFLSDCDYNGVEKAKKEINTDLNFVRFWHGFWLRGNCVESAYWEENLLSFSGSVVVCYQLNYMCKDELSTVFGYYAASRRPYSYHQLVPNISEK